MLLVSLKKHYVVQQDEVYSGRYTLSSILGTKSPIGDFIEPYLLNHFIALKGQYGVQIDQDRAFPVEFATNMRITEEGTIVLVSTCRLGIRQEEDEYILSWNSVPGCAAPDHMLIDFLWNVLYLKLATVEDIERFLSGTTDSKKKRIRTSTVLLDDNQQKELIAKGSHETFSEESLNDQTRVVCKQFVDYINMQHMMMSSPATPDLDFNIDDLMPLE